MDPIELSHRLGRWSSGRGPLYLLLAARLRAMIDDAELAAGQRLPPDRKLATSLAVGRSTVVAAYDVLAVEGRIIRRQGSGTRVAGTSIPEPRDTTDAPVFLHLLEPNDNVILLACAAPDSPPPELIEAYERTLPELAAITGDIGYHPLGHLALRRAIADRYTRRGIPTTPEQILVTTGGQQALSLLARAFLAPGDRVLVEAPTFPGALEAFRDAGAVLQTLPVGLPGFQTTAADQRPRLAYIVPSFHNPTGAILPALDRQRLTRDAEKAGVTLIEDEALIDLGFPGTTLPPALLTRSSDVVSIGSLSKIVWGGLRIGWVRAELPVITRLARLRSVHDLGGNVPAQLAAASLLPGLEALEHRQAPQRQARHDHLRAELAHHLPGWFAPPVSGGQTLWVRLPYGDSATFAQTALRHGVAVLAGSGLDAGGGSQDFLRIHFIAPPDLLSRAIRQLAEAWRDYSPTTPRATASPQLAI